MGSCCGWDTGNLDRVSFPLTSGTPPQEVAVVDGSTLETLGNQRPGSKGSGQNDES